MKTFMLGYSEPSIIAIRLQVKLDARDGPKRRSLFRDIFDFVELGKVSVMSHIRGQSPWEKGGGARFLQITLCH